MKCNCRRNYCYEPLTTTECSEYSTPHWLSICCLSNCFIYLVLILNCVLIPFLLPFLSFTWEDRIAPDPSFLLSFTLMILDSLALVTYFYCLWICFLFSQVEKYLIYGISLLFSFSFFFTPHSFFMFSFSFVNSFFLDSLTDSLCLAWRFIFSICYLFILEIQNELGIFIRELITPGIDRAFYEYQIPC